MGGYADYPIIWPHGENIKMVRATFLWIGKNLVALVVIATILAYGIATRNEISSWIDKQRLVSVAIPGQISDAEEARATLEKVVRNVDRYKSGRIDEFEKQKIELASMGESRLNQRRATNLAAISAAKDNLLTKPKMLIAIGLGQSDKVSRHYQAAIDIKLLQLETDSLNGLVAISKTKFTQDNLRQRRKTDAEKQSDSFDRWKEASDQAKQLNDVTFASGRNLACRTSPLNVGC